MTGRGRTTRRLLSSVGVVCVLAAAWLHPAVATDAAWTDVEQARGAFTARVVTPVTLLSCVAAPGLLGLAPTVTVDWTVPADFNGAGDVFEFGAAPGVAPATLTLQTTNVSTTNIPGGLRTVFSGPLLGALLGGYATIGIRVKQPSGWTSQWATATGGVGLLGLGNVCVVNPTGPTPT